MKSICLFEAGGTKTTLLIDHSGKLEKIELPGFNPNRYSSDFEHALEKVQLPQNAYLIFYGSGLVSEKNKEIVRSILFKKIQTTAEIYDDQLGAARAAYGESAGLIAIMGTGAFAAWFNGDQLENRKGGYGYLIDDIGGGFELGKILLSKWLNNDLDDQLDKSINELVKIKKEDFTTTFYALPDLGLVAEVPKLLFQQKMTPEIEELLINYFDLFFERHIRPILAVHPSDSLALVGSVGLNFEKFIQISASKTGLTSLRVIGNPSGNLLEFHRRKGFKS